MKAYKFKGRSTHGDIAKYIVGIHDNIIVIHRTMLLHDKTFIPEYEKQGWIVIRTFKTKALLKSIVGFSLENFLLVAEAIQLLLKENLDNSK